jgi:hypothetical protein
LDHQGIIGGFKAGEISQGIIIRECMREKEKKNKGANTAGSGPSSARAA